MHVSYAIADLAISFYSLLGRVGVLSAIMACLLPTNPFIVHSESPARSKLATAILILGIFLIATNLRSPITGVGAVLDQIIQSFKLNASQAGMLTTLPLLAFSMASPLATRLARKHGLEISLFVALLLIGLGIGLRMIDFAAMLYIGTAVIGIGIAIGNVLLPSLVKRDFPHKVAIMTSTYVLAMGIFSGGYSAVLIPLAEYRDFGWQFALACYGLITLISIFVWLPQLRSQTLLSRTPQHAMKSKIWHHALAWHVTLLLGLNSFFTYIILAWLPTILVDAGLDAHQAGVMHGMLQFGSALPGIALLPLLAYLKDYRLLTVLLAILGCLCSLGMLYLPGYVSVWSITLGFCSGGMFILGISYIGLRTNNSSQAASLSGMTQFVGYLLAATGPMIAGSLHSYFDNWAAVLWLCAIASLLCAVFGYLGGRNVTIDDNA